MIFAEILIFTLVSVAQEIDVHIKVLPDSKVRVEGKLTKEFENQTRNWSFINSIAGNENLGARISDFDLSNEQNRVVSVKKIADGEYLANEKARVFKYSVNAKALSDEAAMAHVSWLSDEKGLLMLGDLLPQFSANDKTISARIEFDLPNDWRIISNEKSLSENIFLVKDIEKAIFLVGRNWREQKIKIGETNLSLAISGEWKFSDAEAATIVGEIYQIYKNFFGESPAEKPQIFLIRFPSEINFGRWQAETRGSNLTVLSSDMPFKTQSVQRFHEQMRHELFHLWIPNNLALKGNYDWFYEGFTVYQALRAGVWMNQIRFEDFLSTLAEAYNLDRLQERKMSLIEASKTRWHGSGNPVYARGMLAAFLCDAALLQASKGKLSIENIFREVYQKHRVPNESEDGNAAILRILKNYPALDSIIKNYITGAEAIDWETALESLGIESADENHRIRLKVKNKLKSQQKDLLNELGYNNWRKISGSRK